MIDLLLLVAQMAPTTPPDSRIATRIERVLARNPVVDGHNDLPWELRERFGSDPAAAGLASGQPGLHTDVPRLRAGGVGAQFWSVYVPSDWAPAAAATATFEQIDLVRRTRRAATDEPCRHDLVIRARASECVGDVAEQRVHADDQHRVLLARHR